jgi:hypothetical protein
LHVSLLLLVGFLLDSLLLVYSWPPQVREQSFHAPHKVKDQDMGASQDKIAVSLATMKGESDAVKGELKNLEKKIDTLLGLLLEKVAMSLFGPLSEALVVASYQSTSDVLGQAINQPLMYLVSFPF